MLVAGSILLLNNELFYILLLVYRPLCVWGGEGLKLFDGDLNSRVGNVMCSVGSLLFTLPSANIQLNLCKTTTLKKDHKLVFKTNYCLMQVKSIAECSKGSILQYFRPSLNYHLSLRSLFCLFLSGRFTQVLL